MINGAILSSIRRWHFRDGFSIREIGRRTGLSRNTIKKYLSNAVVEPRYPKRRNPSKLDAYAVHCNRATKAVLDHIESYLSPAQGKVVLHWFTGSKTEAKRAIEMGCYFSINAAMLDNERHSSMVAPFHFIGC